MIDAFPYDQVGVGSGWALVAFFVWLLFTGRVIPRASHERELERAEHDAQEWRTEGRIKDAQIAEKDAQIRHMEEGFKTLNSVMGSIQRMYKARKGDL